MHDWLKNVLKWNKKMTQHFSDTTILLSGLWQQNFSKGKFVAKQAFFYCIIYS